FSPRRMRGVHRGRRGLVGTLARPVTHGDGASGMDAGRGGRVSRTAIHRGALEALDRILNRGGDADDVLREVVTLLHERAGYGFAGIAFSEEGRLELGPTAGSAIGPAGVFPISYRGTRV